jgi:hypothetical protein
MSQMASTVKRRHEIVETLQNPEEDILNNSKYYAFIDMQLY